MNRKVSPATNTTTTVAFIICTCCVSSSPMYVYTRSRMQSPVHSQIELTDPSTHMCLRFLVYDLERMAWGGAWERRRRAHRLDIWGPHLGKGECIWKTTSFHM